MEYQEAREKISNQAKKALDLIENPTPDQVRIVVRQLLSLNSVPLPYRIALETEIISQLTTRGE